MLTGQEHFYPIFAAAVKRVAAAGTVIDLGTTCRFRKELKPFAESFTGHYFALDYHVQRSFGDRTVDVDGDIHHLPFTDKSADGVVCIEVLEHLKEPQAAVDEMYRVLCSGGLLLLTTPFLQAYHGKPGDYQDFYRYTNEGLLWLLRRFSTVRVEPIGGWPYRLLHHLIPDSLRDAVLSSPGAMYLFNALDRRLSTSSPIRWLVWAEK